jgi:alanyl aminopeptidase
MRHRVVVCAFVLSACARVTVAPTPPAPKATPPGLRLSAGVRPTGYALALRVDPNLPVFSGTVEIDLTVDAATSLIWLNAADLRLDDAQVTFAGRSARARIVEGDKDHAGFAFDRPVGPGPVHLRVRYQGHIYDNELAGVFRQTDLGEKYQFTQFESFDARRAFPCVDEPGVKAPWRLALTVPGRMTAVANTPAVRERDAGGGWKTVSFAPTPPLPPYLVAFAVGPFETVDAGRSGSASTPLRIVVPRGRAAETGEVAAALAPLLTRLEELTGVPLPYPKLDVVAVPHLFGAMENAGLITCSLGLMLFKPGEVTVGRRRLMADVLSHELAHQWFGDLVTASWWDELWLNEAFASWAGPKAIDLWKPEWLFEVDRVADRAKAINLDGLASARQIRQPIKTKDDIGNAFDDITYEKGRAVLQMFEAWLGPDAFRRGVRNYLTEHAHGAATSADFLADISRAVGRDVAPAFSTFLDQPGVPVVAIDLHCPPSGSPRVTLSQSRFLPVGSKGDRTAQWQLPVCLRYGDNDQSHRRCVLLGQAPQEVALDDVDRCPRWLLGNDRMTGYYVSNTPPALTTALLDPKSEHLGLPERVGVLRDLGALIIGGQREAGQVLARLPEVVRGPETSPRLLQTAAAMVDNLEDHLVPDNLRPNYARLVQGLFGARARALGWSPRPAESDEDKLLRERLVPLVAVQGKDQTLTAGAESLVRAWLDDRHSVPPDLVDAAIDVATPHGDQALFNRLLEEARKKTTDSSDRRRILNALGQFEDPTLVRAAFGVMLTGDFEISQSAGILFRHTRLASAAQFYSLMKERYAELTARLPHNGDFTMESRLPGVATFGCDPSVRADAEAFFRPRMTSVIGGIYSLDQALERIDLCVALKKAQQSSVSAFLRRY